MPARNQPVPSIEQGDVAAGGEGQRGEHQPVRSGRAFGAARQRYAASSGISSGLVSSTARPPPVALASRFAAVTTRKAMSTVRLRGIGGSGVGVRAA